MIDARAPFPPSLPPSQTFFASAKYLAAAPNYEHSTIAAFTFISVLSLRCRNNENAAQKRPSCERLKTVSWISVGHPLGTQVVDTQYLRTLLA